LVEDPEIFIDNNCVVKPIQVNKPKNPGVECAVIPINALKLFIGIFSIIWGIETLPSDCRMNGWRALIDKISEGGQGIDTSQSVINISVEANPQFFGSFG
jgi:hypothetical protein